MKLFTIHLEVPISTAIPILYNFVSFKIFWCVSFGDGWKKSLKPELPFCFQYLQGLVRGDVPHILQKQTVLKGLFRLKVVVREVMWNLEAVSVNQCKLLVLEHKIWLGWVTDKGKSCPCFSSTLISLCISPLSLGLLKKHSGFEMSLCQEQDCGTVLPQVQNSSKHCFWATALHF